jgi:hypothetical protein
VGAADHITAGMVAIECVESERQLPIYEISELKGRLWPTRAKLCSGIRPFGLQRQVPLKSNTP